LVRGDEDAEKALIALRELAKARPQARVAFGSEKAAVESGRARVNRM
jgi:hypothetical protein